MRLRDLAPAERPRERMLSLGPQELRDDELLAIVLGTGRGSGEDALQLAARLIADGGGVAALAALPVEALNRLRGVGPVKLSRIAAAFELGRRALAGHGPSNLGTSVLRDDAPTAGADTSEPPPPPWRAVTADLRAQIAVRERALLAVRASRAEPPVTLALGEALGTATRAGAVLARLLAAPGSGPWWIVAIRPGGPVQKRERDAAERVAAAARLIDVPLAGLALAAGSQAHLLGGDVCAEGQP
jgi:hypothetical protein